MHPSLTRLLSAVAVAVAAAVAAGAGGVEDVDGPVMSTRPSIADTVRLSPAQLAAVQPTPLSAVAAVSRPPSPPPTTEREPTLAAPRLAITESSEGWLVAGGGSRDDIGGAGPTVRWTLEVEPATGVDVAETLARAEGALFDGRSWARDHELIRVDDPRAARVRVVIATPATVDRLCARAGLRTNGHFSCWNGRVAAINADRWLGAVEHLADLTTYRRYVVNHEFGHALGNGHRDCTGPGGTAHVMQQQTRTLGGCVPNPWPHPTEDG